MSEALWAQNFGEGYDFSKGIDEGKSFSELNPEQQAELMQQAYLAGFFDPTSSSYGKFIYTRPDGTTVDYTAYLNDALQQVRSGQGAP
jgi:outer membrane protein assembly factor BamD (BamD/ComL family)